MPCHNCSNGLLILNAPSSVAQLILQESRRTQQAFQDLRMENVQLGEQVRYLKLQVTSSQQVRGGAK